MMKVSLPPRGLVGVGHGLSYSLSLPPALSYSLSLSHPSRARLSPSLRSRRPPGELQPEPSLSLSLFGPLSVALPVDARARRSARVPFPPRRAFYYRGPTVLAGFSCFSTIAPHSAAITDAAHRTRRFSFFFLRSCGFFFLHRSFIVHSVRCPLSAAARASRLHVSTVEHRSR